MIRKCTNCGREVMRLIFVYQSFYFFKHQNSSLGQLQTDGDVVPTFVAALEVFNRYGLQHVHYTLLNVFFYKGRVTRHYRQMDAPS